MSSEFFSASLFNLGINISYTIIALLVGVYALKFIDKQLLTKVDIEEELKNGNLAVALFASTILLFVGLIVSFGFKP